MGVLLRVVRVGRRAIVRRREEGWEVWRGVCRVCREERQGKAVGMGEREGSEGRRVNVRSRVRRAGKVMGGVVVVVERLVRGLERRIKVWRLGVRLRKRRDWRVVMLQEVRSSRVKVGRDRVDDVVGPSRGLKARERI